MNVHPMVEEWDMLHEAGKVGQWKHTLWDAGVQPLYFEAS